MREVEGKSVSWDRFFAVVALAGCCARIPNMRIEDHITIEPDKCGGKPCIRGLRITVADVLDYLAGGMTTAEILHDFPDLNESDIRACLAFAARRERQLAQSA
jgi:uncharacterized protein (DUF433 family)